MGSLQDQLRLTREAHAEQFARLELGEEKLALACQERDVQREAKVEAERQLAVAQAMLTPHYSGPYEHMMARTTAPPLSAQSP